MHTHAYVLVLCNFDSENFSCCEPFLQVDDTNKSCFLQDELSGNLTSIEGQGIASSICELLASSHVTDTTHQKAVSSLDTTSAAGGNTYSTRPNHSNSQNLSPSTKQNNNPSSTAVIWGLVVGVVMLLFVAAILLLAAVCVIKAAKKSKYNAWVLCKWSFFIYNTHAGRLKHLNPSHSRCNMYNVATITIFPYAYN